MLSTELSFGVHVTYQWACSEGIVTCVHQSANNWISCGFPYVDRQMINSSFLGCSEGIVM